ncbi:Tat proofreading chaperone DmsD [Pantoea sp. LMR881]|uniref:Tat proofreading chaperone DmsD n=1 Tax=Pantoea sp. LMR881 TaxID=3014336 RepID=UPI0022B05379|nr:Tat proofreading chaperone DmsD [Pantoea sp. LMR881]MCZ4060405.1 Tat proofreading chaperone DmsD [Pantoea sp. LMR881]
MQDNIPFWPQILNLLASGYLVQPDKAEFKPVLDFFAAADWPAIWPVEEKESLQPLTSVLSAAVPATLYVEWQRLFMGPAALPAPPWGSVWLDPEQVLNGDSTLRLKTFLAREEMTLHGAENEPVDHIGLMLLQAAWLAQEERFEALQTLLSEHLMSWLPAFVETLKRAEPVSFYTALSELTLLTVSAYCQQ